MSDVYAQIVEAMADAIEDRVGVDRLSRHEAECAAEDALAAALGVTVEQDCETCHGGGWVDRPGLAADGHNGVRQCPAPPEGCNGSGRVSSPVRLILGEQVGWAILEHGVTSWRHFREGEPRPGRAHKHNWQPTFVEVPAVTEAEEEK
jgi:hypothetical protein